jgi:hypothetical protein
MKIAQLRTEGKEPDANLIDLYSRISNTQRRHLEAIGYSRVPRDVTPSLSSYIRDAAEPEDTQSGIDPQPKDVTPALADYVAAAKPENGGES